MGLFFVIAIVPMNQIAAGQAVSATADRAAHESSPPVVRRIRIDPPAGHSLAAVKNAATGQVRLVQQVASGEYLYLGASFETEPSAMESVFTRDTQRTDFDFLLPPEQRGGMRVEPAGEGSAALKITVFGKRFTEYHVRDLPKPFFYPVLAPGGVAVTRHFPMRTDQPDEERDHPHQRSLWFAFGSVNGVDFWTEHEKAGTIRHVRFGEIVSGPVFGSFEAFNEWRAPAPRSGGEGGSEANVLCTDRRQFRVYATPDARLLDYEITLIASHGPVKFGDTKEGMMAMRLAPWLCLSGKVKGGRILNSAGDRDAAAWGKRAAWVDYWGTYRDKAGERVIGVAIFDHPSNFRHPTWWHARDYGLFAANPFGQHDFEGAPAGAGDYELKAGEQITFRYRAYIHSGDAESARVSDMWQAWSKESK